ncbi:MAG TPA: exosortase K [Polyangiaceae bacterium]|nr:exosortase K [Polyangiaceae bacterium]
MTSEALERTDHGPRRPAGVLSTLVWLTLVATPAAAVKLRYGNAPVDDYAFILRPTCGLVSLVSGERFAQVSGLGWVCKELELAVVPACAGINYLVVVWLTFGLGLGGKRVGLSRRLCWLPIAALAAFGLTIAVNAVRIGLSVLLRDVSLSIISAEQAHRVLGVSVYLVALWAIYEVAQHLLERPGGVSAAAPEAAVPLPRGVR